MGKVGKRVFKNPKVKKIDEAESHKMKKTQDNSECENSVTSKKQTNKSEQSNNLFEKFQSIDNIEIHNDEKHYYLRKGNAENVVNKKLIDKNKKIKIQENVESTFKRDTDDKTERNNETSLSNKKANSFNVAEVTKKFASDFCLAENSITCTDRQNEIKRSEAKNLTEIQASVKNDTYKIEAFAEYSEQLEHEGRENTQKKGELLNNKSNTSLKTDILQGALAEKTENQSKELLRIPNIKRKRKKSTFSCPIKKIKNPNDMERVDIKLNDEENSSTENFNSRQKTKFEICSDEAKGKNQEIEMHDMNDIKKIPSENSKCNSKQRSKFQISTEKAKENFSEKGCFIEQDGLNDSKTTPSEKLSKVLKCKGKTENKNFSIDYSFANMFDIKIPLIGKKVIENDEKPFISRYDLAIEKNKRRFRFMKEVGELKSFKENLKPWEIEANKSEKEKKEDADRKKRKDIGMAIQVTKICMQILQRLNNDDINEKQTAKLFIKFLLAPVTPVSLLYVPHFVHTISFCRGCKRFSKYFRLIANECYKKCHAMFPVPLGYNFETVYTATVQKFLSDSFDPLEDTPLDYGDISDIDDSSDEENNF